jgi:hypothetical protein
VEQIRNILRGRISEVVITDTGYLVMDSSTNGQPVERAKKRGDVIRLFGFTDEASSRILHSLKLVSEVFGTACKEAITIVEARENKSTDQNGCSLRG